VASDKGFGAGFAKVFWCPWGCLKYCLSPGELGTHQSVFQSTNNLNINQKEADGYRQMELKESVEQHWSL